MGPLSGGDRWARTARSVAAWMRPVYERTWMCVRRPAAAEHVHAGQDARSETIRGGLLFGYFLLATQEKVTRAKRENVLSAHRDDAPAGCSLLISSNGAKCKSIAAHAAPTGVRMTHLMATERGRPQNKFITRSDSCFRKCPVCWRSLVMPIKTREPSVSRQSVFQWIILDPGSTRGNPVHDGL